MASTFSNLVELAQPFSTLNLADQCVYTERSTLTNQSSLKDLASLQGYYANDANLPSSEASELPVARPRSFSNAPKGPRNLTLQHRDPNRTYARPRRRRLEADSYTPGPIAADYYRPQAIRRVFINPRQSTRRRHHDYDAPTASAKVPIEEPWDSIRDGSKFDSSDVEMADVDTDRRDGGGRDKRDNRDGGYRGRENRDRREGGYQGGGLGNRKRRYREDDDYDRRPQRRRFEEPNSTRVKKALCALAESAAKDPAEEASSVAKLVADNIEDTEVKSMFINVVRVLILEQPLKVPFLAGVVLYLNEQKPEIASEVLTTVQTELQGHLEAGRWREFKVVLRFFACLQALFEGDGVFPVLEELFNRAVDMQAASSEDVVGLELVKIILLTLPYLFAAGAVDLESKILELLEKTDIVASTPHTLDALVDPWPGNGTEKPYEFNSVISLLQKQLQREASRGWEFACIPRLFKATKTDDGMQEGPSSTKHPFPEVNIPSPVNAGSKSLFPEAYFSLYTDQDIETVPPITDIASCLIRDVLTDTINLLDFNRHATAKYLIEMDCYWAPDTFVKRGTPFDKLREVAGDKSTWKPEDLAVDAVFSQIFVLPIAEHKLVYYHSVITEACKIAPAAIAPSLGRAIRFIFRNLDILDMELGYRFMDWFSHHLSNFEFRWKWTEWVDDVARSDLHPKKAFIIGVLDKEIRLSFAKRIRETLPQEYHHLIPEQKDKDTPDFKYAADTTPYAVEGRELLTLLRKKVPEDEVQEVVNKIHEQAIEHGVTDPLVASTDALITSLCFIGSKSLSHFLSSVERNKDRLLQIGPNSPAARLQIIASVVDYWKDQPGIAVNIIDKLLNYTIITPLSVIEWAFSDNLKGGKSLSEAWTYEMVATTIGKVTRRVRQIVAARIQPGLPDEQISLIDDTLVKERNDMRSLFNLIADAVASIANGTNDQMVEEFGGLEQGGGEDERLLKQWGNRWQSVFGRKRIVEEAVVGEAVVEVAVTAIKSGQKDVEINGAEVPANGAEEVMDDIS